MEIYFVRHIKTKANANRQHQSLDEGILTESTVKQSVVEKLKQIAPTHFYTSPLQRTQQTADLLAKELSLPVEKLDVVREMGYPTSLHNVSHVSLSTLRYGIDWFRDAKWIDVDADAESRWSFFQRFKKLQDYLYEHHSMEDRIVVVTHSFFIIGFVLHMCRKTPRTLWQMLPYILTTIRFKNGSITQVRYTRPQDGESSCGWEVISFDSV